MVNINEFKIVLKDRLIDISDEYNTTHSFRITDRTETSFYCSTTIIGRNGIIGDLDFINKVLECVRFTIDYFDLNVNLYEIKNRQVLRGWRENGAGFMFTFIISTKVNER